MQNLVLNGRSYSIRDLKGQGLFRRVQVDDEPVNVEILREISADPIVLIARVGSRVLRVSVARPVEGSCSVEINGRVLTARLEEIPTKSDSSQTKTLEGPVTVRSPMAGKIAAVKVSEGSHVEVGQAIVMLEAMKMENEIASPTSGTVKAVYARPGALAKPGEKLVLIE